ncbi:hypothetical protein ZOSMA_73G00040 [Zostera marina]|uniref:Glycolipid transfer protein domain-containing protein n=1 Tax=Zostera marina TaxID=29655 RepID=A0A0K9NRU3_ZOSMR|nr:hypothetical protein ZOSMA_73G00040 [Zostera marina]
MVQMLYISLNISPANVAIDAYERVFSGHHAELLRNIVKTAMQSMPSRSRLMRKINEDDASTRVLLQRYVTSSHVVIRYVQETFHSRNLGIDWYVHRIHVIT